MVGQGGSYQVNGRFSFVEHNPQGVSTEKQRRNNKIIWVQKIYCPLLLFKYHFVIVLALYTMFEKKFDNDQCNQTMIKKY